MLKVRAALRAQRLCHTRRPTPFLVGHCCAAESARQYATEYKNKDSWAREQYEKLNKGPALKKYLADGYQRGQQLTNWTDSAIPVMFRTSPGNCKGVLSEIPNFWLRDHCRCEQCVNQDTMQKAFDTFSIPASIKPETVITEDDGLRVIWSINDHVSFYPWAWLWRHARRLGAGQFEAMERASETLFPELWQAQSLSENPPSLSYDEVMADDEGVGRWMTKLQIFGFCYVDGCPISPEQTKKLLERIAFIRETHYGGFYDFTSDLTMKDTAYTSLALDAHTDTTYFTDPAGLQMFHLLSHTDGEGGASLLVDGFKAAKILSEQDRDAFNVLSEKPVSWHASGNEGITITPAKKFPVLNFGSRASGGEEFNNARVPNLKNDNGELIQVRWNNDDRGLVDLGDINDEISAGQWYEAARKFDEIIKREDMQYWAQLEPGRPLLFDNWRVLHGRSAFTGKRRICGGYINHDDYISRWRNTNFGREAAIRQII